MAAFGKHAAWDDHLDDLGLESERLVSLKQVLYREGIASNIDSGAWERLEPSQRLDDFGHDGIWWLYGDVVVGRLWASADGKGRTRYPMVVCAHCRGTGIDWAMDVAMPRLRTLEEACRAAGTQPEVIAALDAARGELRAALPPATVPMLDTAARAELLQALHNQSPERLARALYAVSRELRAFSTTSDAPPDFAGRAQALRLPIVAGGVSAKQDDEQAPLRQWLAVLLGPGVASGESAGASASNLDPGVPVLLVRPRTAPGEPSWVDALVGDIGAAQIFALKAGAALMPLASDVPYTIDEAFMQQVASFVAASRDERSREIVQPRRRLLAGGGGSGRLRHRVAPGAMLAFTATIGLACGWPLIAPRSASAAIEALQPSSRTAPPASSPPPVNNSPPASSTPEMGRPPLEPRDRYNALLADLQEAISEPGQTDQVVKARVDAFIASVGDLPGGIAFLREVEDVLLRLRTATDPSVAADVDATRAGPGSLAGVVPALQPDGRIRFVLPVAPALSSPAPAGAPGSDLTLDFVRVIVGAADEPQRVRAVWISTTEVSVQLFNDVVRSWGSWEQARALMPVFRPEDDERNGPRTWEWAFGRRPGTTQVVITGLGPVPTWLQRSERAGSGSVYAPDLDPGRPDPTMPMQHLGPEAAIYAAALLNCRLPTSDEWRAADRSPGASPTANLRDRTWARQQKHIEGLALLKRRVISADAGGFVPLDAPAAPQPKSADIVETDDGVLWFAPVQRGAKAEDGSKGLLDLRGNVAEYVIDHPDAGALGAEPAAIRAFAQNHPDAIRIIGGSAISSPAIDPALPQRLALSEAREGYADVGFRLAFSARGGAAEGQGTAAERVASVLNPLPLLNRPN